LAERPANRRQLVGSCALRLLFALLFLAKKAPLLEAAKRLETDVSDNFGANFSCIHNDDFRRPKWSVFAERANNEDKTKARPQSLLSGGLATLAAKRAPFLFLLFVEGVFPVWLFKKSTKITLRRKHLDVKQCSSDSGESLHKTDRD